MLLSNSLFKHERVRKSEAEIAAALSGDYRAEHLFVFAQVIALYESYQQQICACDAQINDCQTLGNYIYPKSRLFNKRDVIFLSIVIKLTIMIRLRY